MTDPSSTPRPAASAPTSAGGVLPALRGALVAVTVALSTTLLFSLMIPLALLKLLVPWTPLRRLTDHGLNALATLWIAINSGWMALVGRTRFGNHCFIVECFSGYGRKPENAVAK